MPNAPRNLLSTFTVITPDQSALPVALTPEIYQQLDARFDGFRGCALVACHRFENDWPSWERHPAGDEVVCLLAGSIDMVLEGEGGEEVMPLREPGDYVIVPRGRWHTARNPRAALLLFVTPGEGTEHRTDHPTRDAAQK